MEKLTLEHLSPYASNRLKGKASIQPHYKNFEVDCELAGLTNGVIILDCFDVLGKCWGPFENVEYSDFKPILRPLSDLTKPITVEGYNDGKEFVPMEELQKLYPASMKEIRMIDYEQQSGQWMMNTNRDGEVAINVMRRIDRMLYRWHFDIDELIHKGLAIDINTVR